MSRPQFKVRRVHHKSRPWHLYKVMDNGSYSFIRNFQTHSKALRWLHAHTRETP